MSTETILPDVAFSREQKEYLQGYFTGLACGGMVPFVGHLPDGRLTNVPAPGLVNGAAEAEAPAEETVYGTPVSDLCEQELWKLEQHGLDVWDKLVAHANEDKFPDKKETFRFRYHGLFYVAPAQNAFMLRCRIPAGEMTSLQLRGLADLAEEWGGGYADITTRANFQIREIVPRNMVKCLLKLQEIGLTARGSGVDNVRNITATPTAGIDRDELIDTRPFAKALHYYILNNRDMYDLPRKFNVAFDGGGSVTTVADTNDIGFIAVRVPEGKGVEAGVYFRVELAGITGHQQFAKDSGVLVTADQCVAVAAAIIRVFVENGDRTNRKRARLKYVIDKWGIPKYIEEVEKKLAFKLLRLPLDQCEPRPVPIEHGHIGVYKQVQPGLNYIGVCRNKHRPEIIVVDPRKTETAMAATQHYAIRPKSDLVLLYGLANRLIAEGGVDRDYIDQHTSGFEAFADFVTQFTRDVVTETAGLSAEQFEKIADTIHRGNRVSFWWTMGVNQGHEATRTAQAIINLALMTGHIGRVGTGANSITGQCNAMGSRLFSNTTNLLAGHDFLKAEDRAKIAQILRIDVNRIPDQNSLAYDQIVEGIANERIKGLWVVATNSSHSWINQARFNEIVQKLDFLVVQDMYFTTETAQRAHLVLPAAGWGEKVGTFINSERRIGLVKKVSRAPGQALSDFNIFKLIAQYWGCGKMFEKWSSPESVFQILKELSRGQPCEITGIRDYQMIDDAGGIQWPLPDAAHGAVGRSSRESTIGFEQQRRLFEDGLFYHPDQKARFLFEAPREMPEPTDKEYPFLLLTGRGTSSQWHTQTRTGKSAVLKKLYPDHIYVEMNPLDAEALGIEANQKVLVASRRAEVAATVFLTSTVQVGQLFIPMHYSAANELTFPAVDPYSRQPAYKACAVSVRPWRESGQVT